MKKAVCLMLVLTLLIALSGCHGTRGLKAFEIPEVFDTSRAYEITFWAKNDTNVVQADIYRQTIRDF